MKKSLYCLWLLSCLFVFNAPLLQAEAADTSEEEEWVFGEEEPIDYGKVKPEEVIYTKPPSPPAPAKKEEDPTVTVYTKMAQGLKSITYDQLPEEFKKSFEEHVLEPVVKHFKDNFKLESLKFRRIPEKYTPGEKEHAFLIIGKLTMYNQPARAILREMSFEMGNPHYSLTIELTKGVKLSSLAKELSIIDLDIKKLQLVFSDWNYEDKELGGVKIEKGLNLVGDVQMEGALKPINLLTKLQVIRMFGTIKKGRVGSALYGLIPGRIAFGDGAALKKMMLGVEIVGKLPANTPVPQFMVRGDLSVKVKGVSEPINFTSVLELAPEKATLSGKMDGVWKDPFGIKGLVIGDVGIGGSVLYAGAVPEGFAIKGSIKVGDKKLTTATKVSGTEGVAFVGTMDGSLSYKDMVNFANDTLGTGLSVDKIFKIIPNVEIENPTLQVIPVATTIMGEKYPKGTTIEGSITIFGKTTTIKVVMLEEGIKGAATLPEITIPGLFSLKGTKNPDGTIKAPQVTLAISRDKDNPKEVAEFYAKCFVQLAPVLLGGASADGFIDFTALSGTNIKMKSKLFDQFMFDIELTSKASLTKPPVDLTVKAAMSADGGIHDLTDRLRAAVIGVLGDPTKLESGLKEQTNKCFRAKTGKADLDLFK